jgi:16S rRNA (guanine527-N7)-methyltransferase
LPPDLLTPEDIAPGAAKLGVSLSREQARQLVDYAQLLMRWNSVHNLTSVRSGRELLTHHLLDSLSIVPHVVRLMAGEPARVLDVGSGGGLPGIVLAIAEPSLRLTLVDAVQKKCAFLTQARLELGLRNVEVVHGRAEALSLPPQDIIVARALAALAQIVAWTGHLLKSGGCWLAMKGKRPDDELSGLPRGVHAVVMPLQVPGLDEQRHLIEMRRA